MPAFDDGAGNVAETSAPVHTAQQHVLHQRIDK
jgi:hypothetical protein